MGGCPGICRNPGPGPANPRDWDRDLKPRDSRDRDKNLRDCPATKNFRVTVPHGCPAELSRPVPLFIRGHILRHRLLGLMK